MKLEQTTQIQQKNILGSFGEGEDLVLSLAGKLDFLNIQILRKFYATGDDFPNDTKPHVFSMLYMEMRGEQKISIGTEALRKRLAFLVSSGLPVFTGYDPVNHLIVVSWRGSWNAISWEYDFMDSLVPLPSFFDCPADCRAHHGYLDMYKYMRDQLLANVTLLVDQYPTATIAIAGHSMGAGLNLLTTADYTKVFPRMKVVSYNFGCPRLGNPALVKWLDSIISPGLLVRITHKADPIPRAPSRYFLPGGYLHAPQEVWYNNDLGPQNYTSLCQAENATAEDESCIDSVPLWDYSPEDHLKYLGISTHCLMDTEPTTPAQMKQDPNYIAAVKAIKYLRKASDEKRN